MVLLSVEHFAFALPGFRKSSEDKARQTFLRAADGVESVAEVLKASW